MPAGLSFFIRINPISGKNHMQQPAANQAAKLRFFRCAVIPVTTPHVRLMKAMVSSEMTMTVSLWAGTRACSQLLYCGVDRLANGPERTGRAMDTL